MNTTVRLEGAAVSTSLTVEESHHTTNGAFPDTAQKKSKRLVSHIPVSLSGSTKTEASSLSSSSTGTTDCSLSVPTTSPEASTSQLDHTVLESAKLPRCAPNDPSLPGESCRESHSVMAACVIRDNKRKRLVAETSVTGEKPGARKKQKTWAERETQISRFVPIAPTPVPRVSRPMVLLAQPEDASMLSPVHVFVRRQIEVFCATASDVTQPAPGRKVPIQLHQVGLRCIHCHTTAGPKKVKRAVCYPSSLQRLYHSVSDMKFDHFNHCTNLPPPVRTTLESLKSVDAKGRSTKVTKKMSASTSEYYRDAARRMGMVDGKHGIFVDATMPIATALLPSAGRVSDTESRLLALTDVNVNQSLTVSKAMAEHVSRQYKLKQYHPTIPSLVAKLGPKATVVAPKEESVSTTKPVSVPVTSDLSDSVTCTSLALPDDSVSLNALHCFVRRHLQVFAATVEDVSFPAPGRKTPIHVGQVGIRCIHCTKLPIKDRVKRAVCYPPSISGVYHAVSNMKFDHFAKCRGLPKADRLEFAALRNGGNKRHDDVHSSKTTKASKKGSSTRSTAQYYHTAAQRLGLIDTVKGIRFAKDRQNPSSVPPDSSLSTPVLDAEKAVGISALMIAATDPSVRAAYAKRTGKIQAV